jgi:hypothetical protein
MLVDEYQLGQGLPMTTFKPGDQVSYTEARVGEYGPSQNAKALAGLASKALSHQ